MPIYTYSCPVCKAVEESIRPIEQRDDLPEHCGTKMERLITPPLRIEIKKTGSESAIDMLNNKATDYMKPEHKRLAYQGALSTERRFY